jgi:hypothetical protein
MDIAIRTTTKLIKEIIQFLETKGWSVTKWLCAKEFGAQNNNEHYHYYINIEKVTQKISSVCRYIRGQLKLLTSKKNYCVQVVKDKLKYLTYCTKDGDFEWDGLSDEELSSAEEENDRIELDKKRSASDKVLQYIQGKIETGELEAIPTEEEIIRSVLELHKKWKKAPPFKSLMHCYVNHCLLQLDFDIDALALKYM